MPNTITNYYSFTPSTKAKSSEIDTNFLNHRGTLVPINETTSTASDLSHDLGSSEHRWQDLYCNGIYPGLTTTHSLMRGYADTSGNWEWDLPTTGSYFRIRHNSTVAFEIGDTIASFIFGSTWHSFTETYARFPNRIYFDSNLGSNLTSISVNTAGYCQLLLPKTAGSFGIVINGLLTFAVGVNGMNGSYLQDATVGQSKREAELYDPTTTGSLAGGMTTGFTTLLTANHTPTVNRLISCDLIPGVVGAGGASSISLIASAAAAAVEGYFQILAGASTIGAGFLAVPTAGAAPRTYFTPFLKAMFVPVSSSATVFSFQYKTSQHATFNFSYMTFRIYEL